MIYSWGHSRRFNAASNAIKKEFGNRIQKVTIDAGFTCPNRDGTKSTGGCTFCNNNAFNPSYCQPDKTVSQQIDEGIRFHEKRYRAATNFLAYFQAYSNTYKPVTELRQIYYEALKHEKVIGLIIGTRPDCMTPEIYDLLEEVNLKHKLVVEFGIESIHNSTLELINRGHTFEEAQQAITECNKRGINCGGHLIFGLPGETKDMMLDSAKILSELPLHSLKFHQLQIVRDTKIGDDFSKNPSNYKQFELEEYIEFICEYLGFLSPKIIVERLAGETQPGLNLGKSWGLRYDQVLQRIENRLKELDAWQGKNYRFEIKQAIPT